MLGYKGFVETFKVFEVKAHQAFWIPEPFPAEPVKLLVICGGAPPITNKGSCNFLTKELRQVKNAHCIGSLADALD